MGAAPAASAASRLKSQRRSHGQCQSEQQEGRVEARQDEKRRQQSDQGRLTSGAFGQRLAAEITQQQRRGKHGQSCLEARRRDLHQRDRSDGRTDRGGEPLAGDAPQETLEQKEESDHQRHQAQVQRPEEDRASAGDPVQHRHAQKPQRVIAIGELTGKKRRPGTVDPMLRRHQVVEEVVVEAGGRIADAEDAPEEDARNDRGDAQAQREHHLVLDRVLGRGFGGRLDHLRLFCAWHQQTARI